MSADGRLTFLVTFDRISRRHDVAPLTVTLDDGPFAAVAEPLIEAIYDYARPMCASREIDAVFKDLDWSGREDARPLVSIDLDGVTGFITAGMHIAGRFTAEIVHEIAEVLS